MAGAWAPAQRLKDALVEDPSPTPMIQNLQPLSQPQPHCADGNQTVLRWKPPPLQLATETGVIRSLPIDSGNPEFRVITPGCVLG